MTKSTKILAIDPGNEKSAYVLWNADSEELWEMGIEENEKLVSMLSSLRVGSDVLAVEMIASYGMPVGATVFETCLWVGRFIERWEDDYALVYRKDVKLHLCHTSKAKDANIRQALIDRYGEPGTKKEPGKLYGVKKDIWAALAVAVYAGDKTIQRGKL